MLFRSIRVLRPEALLIIGLVPADSSWGLHLRRKKKQGHPFYQAARFSTIAQVQQLLTRHGFQIRQSTSTLYQKPENLVEWEGARPGMDEEAGFVVMVARHHSMIIP